jgi:threonine dehydrogenase-like Zn-dependent dehydrogenase
MILGCDAAGTTEDGQEVVVHGLVGDPDWAGDETLDPKRSILSERYQGALAEQVVVPRRNLVPKPAGLSFEEAAVPADGLAHGLPDAVHQRGREAGRPGAGAGRRRRCGDGGHRPGAGCRADRLGDQP